MKEDRICKPESAKQTQYRGTSVISNSAVSKERYIPHCFVKEKMLSGEGPDPRYDGTWNTHMARQKYWGTEYEERASRG